MSIVLQYDPTYRQELSRYVYQLESWHSKKHLKRQWVHPGLDDLVPIYGLNQEGPGAFLYQPTVLSTGEITSRFQIERGCQVPPGWVDKHLIFHIESGWGCVDIGPEKQPRIFHAPCLIIIEKADLFSLVAAEGLEGSVTSKSGEGNVSSRPTEDMIREAAVLYPMIRRAMVA